jgi:flagellar hook assembly protein FlgD
VIAALTVAALVVGTVAALSVNQKLRRDGTVARSIKFERLPSEDGAKRRVRVSFRLAETDEVEVAVVNADGEVVSVLATAQRLEGDDTRHRFFWDRRDEDGDPAPPGRYRLRLTLSDADRAATSGERFVIKPRVEGP